MTLHRTMSNGNGTKFQNNSTVTFRHLQGPREETCLAGFYRFHQYLQLRITPKELFELLTIMTVHQVIISSNNPIYFNDVDGFFATGRLLRDSHMHILAV